MKRPGESFIETLARAARESISDGYYAVEGSDLPHRSLVSSLAASEVLPVIAEVKFRSPSQGRLRRAANVAEIARAYERGGARGISVLTEPKHFLGRLDHLRAAKASVGLPVLMKDIVVEKVQLQAARAVGADAVLLIAAIFDGGLSPHRLPDMIASAHELGLEVLLEAHSDSEYRDAMETEADIVGINNRDLSTLEVSTSVSGRLLRGRRPTKPVICESGFSRRSEMEELRLVGADGFLVGSSLMRSKDVEGALRALTGAR